MQLQSKDGGCRKPQCKDCKIVPELRGKQVPHVQRGKFRPQALYLRTDRFV